jgi:hypothetical protein
VIVTADVSGAELSIDGESAGVIDGELRRDAIPPGPHEIRVRAAGRRSFTRRVELHEGAELLIEARLPPAIVESISPWVWVLGSVSIVALAVAIPLGVLSTGTMDLSGRRMGMPTRADAVAFYDSRQREAITADVLYVTSILAAGAAITWLFFPDRSESLELQAGIGSLWLRGAF